jgi:dCTP deaminase
MYLTDNDYIINDFYQKVITNCLDEPKFNKNQIQPASIDLRLSSKVWIQKWVPFGEINVFEHGAFDFIASKYWKEKKISINNPLKIRPNETIFGRTHEKINIPEDCIAKIEAKSSTARLSLSVAYSDYCNPKYIGRYPLQIHNSGKNTIVLYPYMEICQLMLIKLRSTVAESYDSRNRESIYANYDDGSPTKWWDTKTNKELRKRFYQDYGSDTIDPLMNKIDKAISASFPKSSLFEYNKKQVYRRLKKHLGKKHQIFTDSTFEKFCKKEKWKQNILNKNLCKILISLVPVIISSLPMIITFVTGKFAEIIKDFNVSSLVYLLLFLLLIILGCRKSYDIFSEFPYYVETYLLKDDCGNVL